MIDRAEVLARLDAREDWDFDIFEGWLRGLIKDLSGVEAELTLAKDQETGLGNSMALLTEELSRVEAELTRVRYLPREGDLEAIRSVEHERDAALVRAEKAEADPWWLTDIRDTLAEIVEELTRVRYQPGEGDLEAIRSVEHERDAALAALAEATAPLGNQARNFVRVVGERNAALADVARLREALQDLRDEVRKHWRGTSPDGVIAAGLRAEKALAATEPKP